MLIDLQREESTKPIPVSTGHLPDLELVRQLVSEAYEQYRGLDEGKVADYIPALARVPRDLFGVVVAGVKGNVIEVGDVNYPFTIQSVSKPFVFALVCQEIGYLEARS